LKPVDLHALFTLAKEAAALGAAIHREGLTATHTVKTKSSRTDLVTEIDKEAERTIVKALLAARPDDAIVAEEGSAREGTSGVRWVIDPLDGTVNYVYGYPAFAVSICAEIDGKYRVGVVHDSFHGRVYGGIIDEVATRDGVPLQVTSATELADALLGTGFSYNAETRGWQARKVAQVLPRARDIRRSGSAAIDLCLLAAGQIDGYYETGLNAWDYAAGGVIATAAGARVLAFFPKAGPAPLIVAANPVLVGKLLDLLGEIGVINPNEGHVELWR
jgi:myo-inositol-1(or 4)-monophosphatase